MEFTWHTIFDWLLNIIASISSFGSWLFTPVSLASASESYISFTTKLLTNNNPSKVQTMIEVFRNFFKEKTPSLLDWAESVQFTPIQIIGITGLTIVVVMSFIKLYSIFA